MVRALGLNPISKKNRLRQAEKIANAESLTLHAWREDGQPGTFAWDNAFERILDRRTKLADRYREAGICLFPWQIIKSLPNDRKKTDRLYWNQGSVPSCSLHGATHSAEAAVLIDIAMGAPRKYDAFNPIYPFYIARGENLAGGLDLEETARQLNEGGAYPVSDVGDNNTSAPRDWRKYTADAKRNQAAVIYVEDELVDKIFRAARAGFHITFGSGVYFSAAREDGNGIKTLYSIGHGGHAQSLGSWRTVRGTEYIFLTNSWGDAYGQSAEGEPAAGGWVDKDAVATLARTMAIYGAPFIALYENPNRADGAQIIDAYSIPYPKNWRQ